MRRSYPAYAESPDGDESSAPPRRVRYHWRNGNEYYPCNRCRRETPRRSRDVQRRRCRASLETIRASLTGNDRDEHVFSLRQSLELYDTYQSKIAEYDRALEASMAALIDEVEKPAKPLSKARVQTKQVNAPSFDVRAALYGMLGVDLTQIHGLGPSLTLKLVSECGRDLKACPSAKHFTSWLCLAPGNKISGHLRRASFASAPSYSSLCCYAASQ